MKPLYSKKFDVEHAKAGAPYCCASEKTAQVLKFDCVAAGRALALIGVAGEYDMTCRWDIDGRACREMGDDYRLVMLPLGTIDGKPVFTGDMLEMRMNGIWIGSSAEPKNRAFINCRWPAPAKAYPVSLMSTFDAEKIFYDCKDAAGPSLIAVASAAIKHAIDAGQVVIAADRDARDLLIARTVHAECIKQCWNNSESSRYVTNNVDINTIIATVPK